MSLRFATLSIEFLTGKRLTAVQGQVLESGKEAVSVKDIGFRSLACQFSGGASFLSGF